MNPKPKDNMLSIAELLPEGLSESAITDIADLVNTVIEEQVEEKINQLEVKVKGFMRLKVDELKDQAMLELQENEQFVRNAKLFESVKTLMALELSVEDEDSAISALVSEQEETSAEVEALTDELRKSFEVNEKLETALTAVSGKIKTLEEENTVLVASVETLQESEGLPFKSSEKALVITENVDKESEKKLIEINDFLTPEVMKHMPSNQNS
tara:strand:+ start:38947 stop:39585 length:639 start_codon:yes stop_codon:yes gene_type:complete